MYGEDVTQNLMQIKTIPHTLNSDDTIEVRGEVYLSRLELDNINERLQEQGKPLLANTRNAAAGTLRQLNSDLVKSRNLSIFIFNIQKSETKKFSTHKEGLDYLESIGFSVIEYRKLCTNYEQVKSAIEEIAILRNDLPYNIDGAVVKVNNLELRVRLGETVKVPKWAVAYKYPPEQKQTIIKDIILNVGRTGQVTPMAVLEPVRVAGSMISKTTLHNFDYIKQKDIRIGDTCIIQKAGDVIPEVIEVLKDKRDSTQKEYVEPTMCPVCLEPLEKDEQLVALRCTNSECPALLYRSILHFVSRDAMDISGLGEAMVEQLIDAEYIHDIADIYYLKYIDILKLDRKAEKSAKNIINSIEKTKQNSLDKLIFGLGIRHIGKKAAKVLTQNFSDIDEIMNASVEQINDLDDYGLIMAESVVDFFNKLQTKQIIEKLRQAGVNLNSEKIIVDSEKLIGKLFVITGSFEKYSRNEIIELIEKNSGKVTNSVTKKVNYVISGEAAGSKFKKANELGIEIIDIDEFEKMLEIKSVEEIN